MSIYYTGIGSRETPEHICEQMTTIAMLLAERDWILRSGGAEGADAAFELGASSQFEAPMRIYLPWDGFSEKYVDSEPNYIALSQLRGYIQEDAARIASEHHPAWSKLTPGARKLHTRNVLQVLGEELDTPSELVICWTPNGKGGGGTGQAIRIAKAYGVPIYDLGKRESLGELSLHVQQITGIYLEENL